MCKPPEQKVLSKLNFFRFIGRFKKMQKKSFLTPLGLVRQYNLPKPYYSPSIIIQGNFHLSKHPNERFDRFFRYFLIKIARNFLMLFYVF